MKIKALIERIREQVGSSSRSNAVEAIQPGQIRLGNRIVALGLLWQPLQSEVSNREQARRLSAFNEEYNLFARSPSKNQVCFSSHIRGHQAGMAVGAFLIDTFHLGKNVLASFAISGDPASIWLVAMRESAVYEDSIHSTKESALNAFQELLKAPAWETIIAPDFWMINGATERDLPSCIELKNTINLHSVNRLATIFLWSGVSLIILVTSLIGWYHYSNILEIKRNTIEHVQIPEKLVPIFPPWHNAPPIRTFVSACNDAISRTFILLLGWQSMPIVCLWNNEKLDIMATWTRQGGKISNLEKRIADWTDERLITGCKGKCASLTVDYPISIPGSINQVTNWTAPETEDTLRERFFKFGIDLKMNFRKPQRDVAENDSTHQVQIYAYNDISFTTSTAIEEYSDLLADVPALVPESLTYTPTSNRWLLTARIYHEL